MKLYYWEQDGIAEFDRETALNTPNGQFGEKSEKITEPMTISLHIEIDKKKYEKLKAKYKTSLPARIFSYFGF